MKKRKITKKAVKKTQVSKTKEKNISRNVIDVSKKYLLSKRDDLLALVLRKKHADLPDNEIGDEIDSALQTVEKEMLFDITNTEKVMLDDIEAALRKIEKKTYGKCESCNKLITLRRLKAMPWARYCINCQKGVEKQS